MSRKYTPEQTEAAFWAKVDASGDCWDWLGYRGPKGYGQFGVNGKLVLVHRFSYELLVGPVPAGLQLDHLCRRSFCVNPDHLEPVTNEENARRGYRGKSIAGRTHCANGHLYDDANTYRPALGRKGRTRRYCRTCVRNHGRAYKARKRLAKLAMAL